MASPRKHVVKFVVIIIAERKETKNRGENEEGKRRVFLHLIFATLPREPVVQRQNAATIERFHSRGQHLCKCIGTKESVYMVWDKNMATVTSCENAQKSVFT